MEKHQPSLAPQDTLFDDWDEKTGEFDTGQLEVIKDAAGIIENLGKRATSKALSPEVDVAPRYVTIEDLKQRLDRQREENNHEDAFSEYSSRAVYPFERVLDAHEPWHEQAEGMIERYQLTELSRSDFERMKPADQKAFSLGFFRDFERAKTLKRLIEENGGVVTNSTDLVEEFGRGRSASELSSYAGVLGSLINDAEATNIPWAVRKALDVPNPHQASPGGKSLYEQRRRKALDKAKIDREKRGLVRTVSVNGKYTTLRTK